MQNNAAVYNIQTFIKVDDNKVVNENAIRWIKKMDECLAICAKQLGCSGHGDTHKVCKISNPESYERLNCHFR